MTRQRPCEVPGMLKDMFAGKGGAIGRLPRTVLFQARLWRHCLRLLKVNRCGTQAAALSYHTIFGIVPLAIVMLLIFRLFPTSQDLGQRVRQFIYDQAHLTNIEYTIESQDPSKTQSIRLVDQIDRITGEFLSNLDTGAITLISGILVIWAAIGLLTTIERAFNNIWHAPRGRSFVHRIINYWALLTLGPLLLGAGFYVSAQYLARAHLPGGTIFGYIRPVLPLLSSIAVLFFLYFLMPSAKVGVRPAIWGAIVAGAIWTGAKYGFTVYLTRFIPYRAMYGVMGLVPLGVLWIFITWQIVLFGLQLTYATQHLTALHEAEIALMKKRDEYFLANDLTVMRVMAYVLEQFERHACPVSAAEVAAHLELPPDFTPKILDHLVRCELLFATAEPHAGYTPATDGVHIALADISAAVAKGSYAQPQDDQDPLGQLAQSHRQVLEGRCLKDLIKR